MGFLTFILTLGFGIIIGSAGTFFFLTGEIPLVSDFFSEKKSDSNNPGQQDSSNLDEQNGPGSSTQEEISSFLNETSTLGDMKFTLIGLEKSDFPIANGLLFEGFQSQARKGGTYLILTLEIENVGKKSMDLPISYDEWILTDSQSRVFEIATTDIPYDKDFKLKLSPGLKAIHKIGFEIPYDPNLSFDLAFFGRIL